MSEMHTPGPWSAQLSVSDTCDFEVVDSGGVVVAGEYGIEEASDAALIARAPDLLADNTRLTARVAKLEATLREVCDLIADARHAVSGDPNHDISLAATLTAARRRVLAALTPEAR